MRTYQQLRDTGAEGLKRRLIKRRGSVCQACGVKRRNGSLIVCVADPQKEICDSNLVVLDPECQKSLVMILRMFCGGGKTGIEHLYDYRGGEGTFKLRTPYGKK